MCNCCDLRCPNCDVPLLAVTDEEGQIAGLSIECECQSCHEVVRAVAEKNRDTRHSGRPGGSCGSFEEAKNG